jgi:hypothetical protein
MYLSIRTLTCHRAVTTAIGAYGFEVRKRLVLFVVFQLVFPLKTIQKECCEHPILFLICVGLDTVYKYS